MAVGYTEYTPGGFFLLMTVIIVGLFVLVPENRETMIRVGFYLLLFWTIRNTFRFYKNKRRTRRS